MFAAANKLKPRKMCKSSKCQDFRRDNLSSEDQNLFLFVLFIIKINTFTTYIYNIRIHLEKLKVNNNIINVTNIGSETDTKRDTKKIMLHAVDVVDWRGF
jgi:hypothetical protein